eukprot:gnl/Spiro4/846_TR461_c0_g1_i1.p2 gnl/Spiro4/846_TR461_c0_g1~~gnl/Spiro4/846_TR461_c0_g1_i1.p2  ORF type:complete len:182 (+),score=3.93 gnl/Spiro4/846_TR461_c0_g1_i1:48-593(+)
MSGDWTCTQCGNVNFERRIQCNRCTAPRADGNAGLTAQYTPQDGDWRCSGCGNFNFGRRTQCNRCHAPRADGNSGPAARRAPLTFPHGDWMCESPGCGNVNFARRLQCSRCNVARRGDGSAVHVETEFWDCPTCTLRNHSRDPNCAACHTVNPRSTATVVPRSAPAAVVAHTSVKDAATTK